MMGDDKVGDQTRCGGIISRNENRRACPKTALDSAGRLVAMARIYHQDLLTFTKNVS